MGTGVGEAMLISAAVGGATSAATGGDPLKGALLGAATGGAFGGLAGAAGGSATGATAGTAAGTTAGTTAAGLDATLAAANTLPSAGAPLTTTAATAPSLTSAGASQAGFGTSAVNPLTGSPVASSVNPFQVGYVDPLAGSQVGASTAGTNVAAADQAKMFPRIAEFYAKNPMAAPAGIGALAGSLGVKPKDEEEDEYSGALKDFSYTRSGYTPVRAASGGLMDTAVARRMAGGGHLGSYSDGGQLLKGREADSNGMKDDIPASIEGSQPALLADGEFVVPADVVSGLGNGSTEAGARQLYAMMEKVREARTGRSKQAPEIDADRMIPA
jgi:hypothetical protein